MVVETQISKNQELSGKLLKTTKITQLRKAASVVLQKVKLHDQKL